MQKKEQVQCNKIKSKEGNVLSEVRKILTGWKEEIGELYKLKE